MSKARANADATSQAYIENIATDQNLSGTYSTERLYFNDSYKLTGDVNITGHLALGSVADSDVVITQDSTERTITGSGTLESGELLSSKQADLTGMTGELGSGVTLGSAVNLNSATFPAGHILQVKSVTKTSAFSTDTTGSWVDVTGLSVAITPSSSSNKILVNYNLSFVNGSNQAFGRIIRNLPSDPTPISVGDASDPKLQISTGNAYEGNASAIPVHSGMYLDSPSLTSEITYEFQVRSGSAGTKVNQDSGGGNTEHNGRTVSSITLFEIKA